MKFGMTYAILNGTIKNKESIMKNTENSARFKMLGAMVIFGTIGIFRKYIPLSSGVVAMVRGFVGVLFLLLVLAVRRERLSWSAIRKNLALLLISGALIGFNSGRLISTWSPAFTVSFLEHFLPLSRTFPSSISFAAADRESSLFEAINESRRIEASVCSAVSII